MLLARNIAALKKAMNQGNTNVATLTASWDDGSLQHIYLPSARPMNQDHAMSAIANGSDIQQAYSFAQGKLTRLVLEQKPIADFIRDLERAGINEYLVNCIDRTAEDIQPLVVTENAKNGYLWHSLKNGANPSRHRSADSMLNDICQRYVVPVAFESYLRNGKSPALASGQFEFTNVDAPILALNKANYHFVPMPDFPSQIPERLTRNSIFGLLKDSKRKEGAYMCGSQLIREDGLAGTWSNLAVALSAAEEAAHRHMKTPNSYVVELGPNDIDRRQPQYTQATIVIDMESSRKSGYFSLIDPYQRESEVRWFGHIDDLVSHFSSDHTDYQMPSMVLERFRKREFSELNQVALDAAQPKPADNRGPHIVMPRP